MKILLLGEGDFSFTFAIDRLIREGQLELTGRTNTNMELVATSLDSRQEVLNKYPSFAFAVSKTVNVKIVHSVNALDGNLLKQISGVPDLIIWNHPHLGYEDCNSHFQLLLHFFNEMKKNFPSTKILLSFLTDQIHRWRVMEAATANHYRLSQIRRLNEEEFPGYTCKRNSSGDSFKSSKSRSNWSSDNLKSHFLFFQYEESPAPGLDISQYMEELKKSSGIDESERLSCDSCGKKFGTQQGLTTHIRQVHELKLYNSETGNCEVCGKEFASKNALEMHRLNAHGKLAVKPECPSHKRQKTQENDGDYVCEVCGSRDKDHVKNFGKNRKLEDFVCETCGKEFRSQRALNQHINVSHVRIDSF
jgi:hypothetical protein